MNAPNAYIEAARAGKNDLWRYAATMIFSTALILASSGFLVGAALLAGQPMLPQEMPPAVLLLVGLPPFAFALLGLWLGLRLLHNRGLRSLLHPTGPFRWGLLALSAGAWLALAAASDLALALLRPGTYVLDFRPAQLIPYALLVLLLIPVQVAAEELIFRGYLAQGFGLAGGFWAAWLVPGVFFGLLHGVNPEVSAYGLLLTMPVYIGLGLLLGWLTLRSAGLELALGLHLANNLYSTLLVTAPASALPAPALVRIVQLDPAAALVIFLISVPLYLLLLRFAAPRAAV